MVQETEHSKSNSLYERLGGEAGLSNVTESLYARVMLDDALVPFFAELDVPQIEARQRSFLSFVFDGPGMDRNVDLRVAHAGLVKRGLSHHHFDLLLRHLTEALQEHGASPTDLAEAISRVEATRRHVMGETYSKATKEKTMISRITSFMYGLMAYGVGNLSMIYAACWLGDYYLPVTLDSEPTSGLLFAVSVNLALVVAFGIQHSVMARPAFKEWWTKIVPSSVERSTYVLVSGLAFIGMMYFWQPIGIEIWRVDGNAEQVAYGLYGIGWALLLYSTFLINHFDLFGLRQVWSNLRGIEYVQLPFEEKSLYKVSRHPLYVGWLMVIWCTPHMTISHLFFSAGITAYILFAIRLEERDLVRFHPEYATYRQRVPMLFPKLLSFARPQAAQKATSVGH